MSNYNDYDRTTIFSDFPGHTGSHERLRRTKEALNPQIDRYFEHPTNSTAISAGGIDTKIAY